MNKVAFITMDVESFYDTSCIKDKNIPSNDEYDCAEELDKFIDFLDERNVTLSATTSVTYLVFPSLS